MNNMNDYKKKHEPYIYKMNPMPDDVKEMLGIPIQSKSRSRSEPRTPRKTPSKVILVRT